MKPEQPLGASDRRQQRVLFFAAIFTLCCLSLLVQYKWIQHADQAMRVPAHAAEAVNKCLHLHDIPGSPKDFHSRAVSDRFVPGTPPVLIRNASIWTGDVNGHEVIKGNVLLDQGIIQSVGNIESELIAYYGSELVTINANGSWVTPGLVDLHSHLGVDSSPLLRGAADTNSIKGLTQPWLRSLDGLNTHDDAYRLSISGGLTTAVVLPGSANAIGGQAFVIKLRSTAERSPSAMLLEPPHTLSLNGTSGEEVLPLRWRQMKQACGENPSRVYSGTRMDTIWAFRKAYDTARQLKEKQDDYCAAALSGNWAAIDGKTFPEDLQWEMLVDVLRGRVKIHNHCYEPVDLDGIVRLTNEFKFPVAAFHHAHSAYLVPDLLKKAWGHPPAIAMFAINGRYKREAYRISEFAPRILAEAGLDVVMKTDHPVLNSRYILFEAQQAHYYGLKSNLALASVTTTPARIMGMDHRIGSIKKGYDADVVIWDSHPLVLGATPIQVFIDGIPQLLENVSVPRKPEEFQVTPKTPNFDKEVERTLKYDGLPPLEVDKHPVEGKIVFRNVGSMYLRAPEGKGIEQVFSSMETGLRNESVVVVQDGHIVCVGQCHEAQGSDIRTIDLEGGSIAPSLISYGSPLGLVEIGMEYSTNDGGVQDALTQEASPLLDVPVFRAIDGLEFGTRDALDGYRAGVTVSIVAPQPAGKNILYGLSTAFSTSAPHKLAEGAIVQEVVALHFGVSLSSPLSVSTQIGILRKVLLGQMQGDLGQIIEQVRTGALPVVIAVESADIMASLILLKREVETNIGSPIKFVFTGATEAHLIAKEIAQANIGVIVTPSRPFPAAWEQRRILPGPPLSQLSSISVLLLQNVTVAIGVKGNSDVRNTRFDLAWAALESGGVISKTDALALASVNLEKLLCIRKENGNTDLVVTKAGFLFEFAKIVGVISPRRGYVELE